LGVRGFPTFIFSNEVGERQLVYGARPYVQFEVAVKLLLPNVKAVALPASLDELFKMHASWCAEEVAVVLGITNERAQEQLKSAEAAGVIRAVHTRNGSVWHMH
jgi:hypothetical protein